MSEPALNQLARVVIQRLESLQRAGVATLPKGTAELLPLIATGAATAIASPTTAASSSNTVSMRSGLSPARLSPSEPAPSEPAPNETESNMPRAKAVPAVERTPVEFGSKIAVKERPAALETLQCQVRDCRLCPELVKNRTQTVFGVGKANAKVVFFGEAPGADEDRTGEPFVGRAGQLLTKIIEACTFRREDVYIMNVLKCRPPDNRTPNEEEVEKCRPFFEQQLAIVRPEYIVCAGAVPMKALFPQSKSVGQMRGKFHDFNGIKVVITYHPAYLLRNPDAKRFVWDDMKMLLADMGIELPKPKS